MSLFFQELVYSHFRKHAAYIVNQMQRYLDEGEKENKKEESESTTSLSTSMYPFAVKSPSPGFLKALKSLLPKLKESFSFLL